MCCLIYKFLLILTQKMQISFLKILPENALKFVSKKMRICVKNFAQLQAIGDKNKKKQLDKVLKEYETYVDRMIEEEWLGSDEDDWIEAEELPFD